MVQRTTHVAPGLGDYTYDQSMKGYVSENTHLFSEGARVGG